MAVRIRDLLPVGGSVEWGTGTLSIRGLELTQITLLTGKYTKTVASLLSNGKEELLPLILRDAPDFVTDVICMAANIDDEDKELVSKFTVGDQITAVMEVWRLTVPQPKKLRDWLSALNLELQKLKQSQEPTTEESNPKIS